MFYKDYESLFLKCMKQYIPIHNKCKNELELWYICYKKNVLNILY
jgi:hypothetical protein